MLPFSLVDVENAARLVHSLVPPTPQYAWPMLSKHAGAEVWVKHENHTPIGAFKIRGGIVYMDWLRSSGKARGRGHHRDTRQPWSVDRISCAADRIARNDTDPPWQ